MNLESPYADVATFAQRLANVRHSLRDKCAGRCALTRWLMQLKVQVVKGSLRDPWVLTQSNPWKDNPSHKVYNHLTGTARNCEELFRYMGKTYPVGYLLLIANAGIPRWNPVYDKPGLEVTREDVLDLINRIEEGGVDELYAALDKINAWKDGSS